jgi:hypothetical protein
LGHQGLNVDWSEAALQGIERQAAQLGFDQVRAVLHDRFEFAVLVRILPARDEMKEMAAA